VPRDLCCPLCGAPDVPFKFAGHPLPIRECACGMVFLWPQPDEAHLREIYQPAYHRGWGIGTDGEAALRGMKHRTFRRLLKSLSRVVATGRVLDVGCATGFFLEVAAEAGWDVYGVELSTYAAELARDKFGDRVFSGTLEQAAYPDEFFDLVMLSDIIEHVPDPRSFLREVRRVLRPGGVVALVTPNSESMSARLMGRHWNHFNAEHLHYFSPAAITRLLVTSGFVVERGENFPKDLNLNYIIAQLGKYPRPFMTALCRGAGAVLPSWSSALNFPVCCGEMMVVARKRVCCPAQGALQ
jgi:SAM-dependent methyltransferase